MYRNLTKNIVPNTFIIHYLDTICISEKEYFLGKVQGVVIDTISITQDLVVINNPNWKHLDHSAVGNLMESMLKHRVLVYPDFYLNIDDPPSEPVSFPSCPSNDTFDICNIITNDFPEEAPDDPLYKDQWYLKHVDANLVWQEKLLLGSGITVAVIDTGIDNFLEDLTTNVLPGYNVQHPKVFPRDDEGHGTQVAGIIAATTNNEFGMASVAPHAKIRPIKYRDSNTKDKWSGLLKAFGYVLLALKQNENYAQIINCSIGMDISTLLPEERKKIEESFVLLMQDFAMYNVMVVFSAGNMGNKGNPPNFPASIAVNPYLDNVISVGGINELDERVPSSNYSSANYTVQVAAPGTNIITTTLNNKFVKVGGTSYAAPIVCGILALMLERIKHEEIPNKTKYISKKLFDSTAKQIGNQDWKYGIVNAFRAIELIDQDLKPII